MARPRKAQPAEPAPAALEQTEPVTAQPAEPAPAALHTPESLGYEPGDSVPLHHLNIIGTPIK